jgi:hypothetical protein
MDFALPSTAAAGNGEITADSKDNPDPTNGVRARICAHVFSCRAVSARRPGIWPHWRPRTRTVIEVTLMLRRLEPIPDESLSRPIEREDVAALHGA